MNPLVGKKIKAVYLAEDGGAIKFDLKGGESIVARADGDCCSHTWIEEVDAPERLIGSEVKSVEDIGMPDKRTTTGECDECLQFYGCKITTAKGEVMIDYRNESNGYYGGSLVWPSEDTFCGGVHGQNVSNEKWKKIA